MSYTFPPLPLFDRIQDHDSLKELALDDLPQLAEEIRLFLIHSLSQTGGHLGANLGTVELTLALHWVFNPYKDRLIWDVSHQAYVHKLLTGRRSGFARLRQKDGLSGFLSPRESTADPFIAGHASTALSAAAGYALGRDHQKGAHDIIAIIGDGALSGGMAFEALNHIGSRKSKFLVILNDNEMSIAPPTGALSEHLSNAFKVNAFKLLDQGRNLLPERPRAHLNQGIEKVQRLLDRMHPESLTADPSHSSSRCSKPLNELLDSTHLPFFRSLGFQVSEPIDGHDIFALIQAFNAYKNSTALEPLVLHIRTQKGKGYTPAERAKDNMHGVSKFEIANGRSNTQTIAAKPAYSYTQAFSQALDALMIEHSHIYAITAAMPSGTGLDKVSPSNQSRILDVGIAEQHAVTLAGGLAASGMKPIVCIYSTFLQRSYDQIIHDIALQNLNVTFVLDRGGYVGADGATHHGLVDLSYMTALPGFTVTAPSSAKQLQQLLTQSITHSGPFSIRFPRDNIPDPASLIDSSSDPLILGKGLVIKNFSEQERLPRIAFVSLGALLPEVRQVAQILENNREATCSIVDLIYAKPLDVALCTEMLRTHDILLFIEEGFGSTLSQRLLLDWQQRCPELLAEKVVHFKYAPDVIIEQATRAEQLKEAELDSTSLLKLIQNTLSE